ncbi:fungal-specific transcription factor domain-containing protein [Aspergillus coremiiformis]|uniref:Fungal-specific transcription factor domain-containing protein n=1 Tax=Aspergillus coremiiformis TaxID=138285 RepID=A0A5N6Z0M6_9EURO|nr:fungal-specific transcription factor domain-containing protein [Aspergillus coremiiformis]
MVVMDDKYNGWRSLILPIAVSDKMVMDAVLAVSAFHLSHKSGGRLLVRPDKLYAQAILGLQDRSSLNEYDMLARQSVFVAIITLLVGVMVNGSSDFPILFHMLQSALDAVGGEGGLGHGEIADFLLRQIRKMRVYAAPLLSQEAGVRSIMSYAQESFDCLHYNEGLHPDHALTFYLIAELRQQAYDIYLQRALMGPRGAFNTDTIERFKESLSLFAEGSLGEHALVWPTFMAASESRTDEHRHFFKQFLEKQYHRNGFLNLQKALKLLEKIWARSSHTNWPALLPEPRVFIM